MSYNEASGTHENPVVDGLSRIWKGAVDLKDKAVDSIRGMDQDPDAAWWWGVAGAAVAGTLALYATNSFTEGKMNGFLGGTLSLTVALAVAAGAFELIANGSAAARAQMAREQGPQGNNAAPAPAWQPPGLG